MERMRVENMVGFVGFGKSWWLPLTTRRSREHTPIHTCLGQKWEKIWLLWLCHWGGNCFIKVLLSSDATTVKHGLWMTTECAIMRCNGELIIYYCEPFLLYKRVHVSLSSALRPWAFAYATSKAFVFPVFNALPTALISKERINYY